MDIKIPQEQWGALIGAAVMQTITQDQRDALIREAVAALLTPRESNSYYGDKRTPLQDAFDMAVRQMAVKIVDEQFGEQLKPQVEAVVRESLEKAFDGERRGKLVENIADAIVKAFRVERY